MSVKIISTHREDISISDFGGKSYWTNFLLKKGFNVPRSIFLSYGNLEDFESFLKSSIYINEITKFVKNGSKYCVRSSGLSEDGTKQSKAGHYLTFINLSPSDIEEAIIKVIKDGVQKGEKIGILIQEMIEPSHSGVAFSSDPISKSKTDMLINYDVGTGDKLVSGLSQGFSIKIKKDESINVNNCDIANQLNELVSVCKKIESENKFPVDVEWCIEASSGRLYILQCRPITNVLYENNQFFKIDESVKNNNELKNIDKVSLRLIGMEHNLYVSPAYILQCNCLNNLFPEELDINLTPTPITTGYSVVLISPKMLDGKILRSFVGTKKGKAIKCNRYGVRLSTKSYYDLLECLKSMYEKLVDRIWSFSIIIQEVFDPYVTGIIKETKDGFMMEILRGHFAAKGVYPMSKYVVNSNFELIYKSELYQDEYYLIVDGNKTSFKNELHDGLVFLEENTVIEIFKKTSSLFVEKGLNVEFGVLITDSGYLPYLIDYTVEKEEFVDYSLLINGVISSGRIIGKLKRINIDDRVGAIDFHFYNEIIQNDLGNENIIYVCDLPSISLLDILGKAGRNIGFVFQEGAMLCHFAVILRELGIPAIVGVDINCLDYDEQYCLDTNAGATLEEKFKIYV